MNKAYLAMVRMALSPNVGLKQLCALEVILRSDKVRMALSPNVGLKLDVKRLCATCCCVRMALSPNAGLKLTASLQWHLL